MVPALLYLYFRKYLKKYWPKIKGKFTGSFTSRSALLLAGFLILMMLKVISLRAQERSLNYNIVRNGKSIGWTRLHETRHENSILIKLESEIKTRFILQFNISTKEEVSLNSGIITYASQYRVMNGDIKENKSLRLTGDGYEVSKGKDIQRLTFTTLKKNMLSLFFEEPVNNSKVFSDKFQRMLEVHKISEAGYKINLPDGNSSSYYYENGVCVKVKFDHTLYSAEMILK